MNNARGIPAVARIVPTASGFPRQRKDKPGQGNQVKLVAEKRDAFADPQHTEVAIPQNMKARSICLWLLFN